MTNVSISATQKAILEHAATYNRGQLVWWPDNIKGGARTKVASSLTAKGLIEGERMTAEGYKAIGRKAPKPQAPEEQKILQALHDMASEALDAHRAATASAARATRTREGTKQQQVIVMLRRREGATGWQQHTVRGHFAGALKRKLGLVVTSEKIDGERVYRLDAEAA